MSIPLNQSFAKIGYFLYFFVLSILWREICLHIDILGYVFTLYTLFLGTNMFGLPFLPASVSPQILYAIMAVCVGILGRKRLVGFWGFLIISIVATPFIGLALLAITEYVSPTD